MEVVHVTGSGLFRSTGCGGDRPGRVCRQGVASREEQGRGEGPPHGAAPAAALTFTAGAMSRRSGGSTSTSKDGRGLRVPWTQRRRQDDHDRDSRGVPGDGPAARFRCSGCARAARPGIGGGGSGRGGRGRFVAFILSFISSLVPLDRLPTGSPSRTRLPSPTLESGSHTDLGGEHHLVRLGHRRDDLCDPQLPLGAAGESLTLVVRLVRSVQSRTEPGLDWP